MALNLQPTLNIMLIVDTTISAKRLTIYLQSGIKTVVSKDQPISELLEALRYIENGQPYVGNEVYQNSARQKQITVFSSLSDRERQVAMMMADRIPAKLIAEELGVSHKTVHSYKDRVFTKLGIDRVVDLIVFVQRYKHQAGLV